MGFSRQEYWSGLPFPPGDLPDSGIEPLSSALAGGFFITEPPGKPGYSLVNKAKWACGHGASRIGKVGRAHQFSSVHFSCSAAPDSLRPHERQHARPPCPSPTPRAYPNSCPLSWWCHPTISSSVIPFSSCPQSFPASESFQMSQFFASGGQSIAWLQHQSLQWTPRTDLL